MLINPNHPRNHAIDKLAIELQRHYLFDKSFDT